MYAIVEIAGQQFKVEKEQEIFVHRLQEDAGSVVAFDEVMLLDNDGKVSVGTPTVEGVQVKAKIVEHMKADKVIVFHKKRRKGYQKQNGHRQFMSKILIEDILTGVKKSAKAAPAKKEEVKAEAKPEVKVAKPKAAAKPKAEAKAKEEKPAAKKAAPKAKAEPKAEAKVAKPKAASKPKAEAKAKEEKPAAKKAAPKAKEEKKDDQ